ncbi:hypothetical protein ID866_10079 [Astraeus odoratus]|nr:hypothetical protein ID866_10079 [Astraeus odoratus]
MQGTLLMSIIHSEDLHFF